jgi:hypothetical protein
MVLLASDKPFVESGGNETREKQADVGQGIVSADA